MLSTLRVKVLLFVILLLGFSYNSAMASQRMAIMGDSGEAGTALNNLRSSVLKEGIQSVIMPGDNLYRGTYENVWDSWKKSGLRFDVVAIGNHNSGYAKEMSYFGMPSENYSVVKGGARFIVLNSDNAKTVEAQMNWLDKEIDRVPERLIFLVYHHPTYSITSSHKWQEKRSFQIGMRKFFAKHGRKVSALLLGHDHMSSFMDFGNIPVVIAGSGREVRNEKAVRYIEDGVRVETRYLAPRTQHWGLLEIADNAQEATIHFVRVSDQKRVCSAFFRDAIMTLNKDCSQ